MNRTILILALPFGLLAGACDSEEPEAERAAELAEADDEPSERAHGFMAKLDADGDGAISRDEAEGHWIAKKFDKLDANGDGLLTPDELATMKKKHRGKGKWKHEDPQGRAESIMAKLDVDGDGTISRDEAEGHWIAQKFDKLDVDGNGSIGLDELASMKHGKRGKRGKHGKHGKHKDPEAHAERKMAKLDADGDGFISLAEAKGTRLEEKFAKIDADGDGKISREELTEHKRAKHERREQPEGSDLRAG
jgi:Ca2+-binding EF-hand superfamily protein